MANAGSCSGRRAWGNAANLAVFVDEPGQEMRTVGRIREENFDVSIVESERMIVLGDQNRQVGIKRRGKPRASPIGANLFCYGIFEPGFFGAWEIPKGHAPAVANRPSSLPDSVQAPPRVGFDGE
jgi:hypothetical protein